jgi:large subunit ribosomal protein L23
MTTPHEIIISPITTEKSTRLMEEHNQVTFKVRLDATKPQIKNAIREIFGIHVKSVNTSVIPGKPKRFGRQFGRTSPYKKAIVTLPEDEAFDLFAMGEFGEGDEDFEGTV